MYRDISRHKARFLLVIAAVSVGMIGTGALLDTWALVQRATAESYLGSHPVSATIRVNAIDSALLARVRAMPAIAAVRARRVVLATVQSNGTELNAQLFAMDDFGARDIGRLDSERGVWPPRDGDISIEKSSLEFSGAALNEFINIRLAKGRPHAFRISGVAHDVSLPPAWMDHIVYGFVTPATLAELGAPTSLNEIQVVVRDSTSDRDAVRRVAYNIKALIERSGGRVTNIDVPIPGRHAHAAQMNSLMLTQGAFGLLTLLVCSFLIVNLFTAMLAGQTREIGVMKSLGASPRQIGTMYLGFSLFIGVLASAVALPLAIAIARPYAALKADMLNFSIAGYAIPWWALAIQVAAGCLLPVMAAAIPVARACRLPVSAALRDPGIATDGGSSFLRRRISVPGVSRPLLLSIGNAFRRRQRMALTVLSLAMGGAVFLGADNVRSSVRESVDLFFSGKGYDMVLQLTDSYPAAESEAVAARVAGVARVQAIAKVNTNVLHVGGMLGNAFTLLAIPPDSRMFTPSTEQGRWLSVSDRNELVISQPLLKDEPALTPGSEVRLMIDGEATQWRIAGVVSDLSPVAYAPLATLNALQGNDHASMLVVATTDRSAAAQLDVVARLRAELERAGMPVARSQLMSETRRAMEDHLFMVVQFLGVMGWVMIVVGGLGLASTMGLAVLERTREIGVLRAIGASHRAIVLMILMEGLLIALLGWLASIPLSTPMSMTLTDAFGRVMFTLPMHYLPRLSGMLNWLLMVTVVSLVASAWPARRATKASTIAAINYE
jgi:putative ABC transport system permease protein